MASKSTLKNKAGKKDDSPPDLTVDAVAGLLTQHKEELAKEHKAEFMSSFTQLEAKFDQICLAVDKHGQRLSSLKLRRKMQLSGLKSLRKHLVTFEMLTPNCPPKSPT